MEMTVTKDYNYFFLLSSYLTYIFVSNVHCQWVYDVEYCFVNEEGNKDGSISINQDISIPVQSESVSES